MRIIIVEDEVVIREGLANMINGSTHHKVIGICKNGIEGLDLICSMKPDCVITDIRMHGMGGLEMLSRLKKQGRMPYSIIISGYSEFEYAREGIALGVEDYLLKPISIDELETVLKKVEKKILEESSAFESQSESYIRDYLFGTNLEKEETTDKLTKLFPQEKGNFGIFVGYYRNILPQIDFVERLIRNIKRRFPDYTYQDVTEGRMCLRILVVQAKEEELLEFTRAFDEIVVGDWSVNKYEIPWAKIVCSSVEEWKTAFAAVQKTMARCLSCGCQRLLSAEDSVGAAKELIYPVQLEKKLLMALSAGNKKETKERTEEFLEFIIQREYEIEDIRRAILRLMSQMMDTAGEINQKAYETLRSEDCMNRILTAYTRTEVEGILFEMGNAICEREKKEGISNYTINRTVEYIRIHYKEGITLEETAEALGITPEYLSMLFKREMGMNFSVFLKEFRISHAKRLLKGTDMKIYEVAEACGYNNSNYFTKVFKEVTGISPADYR